MSRFLDERGRIFGKVNIVDILVLLVIVAVVVFAVVRVSGGGTNTIPVKVTFTVEAVRSDDVAAIEVKWQPGGTVSNDTGTVLGTLETITTNATREEFFNSKDVLQKVDSLIYSDVVVVVSGQGQASSGVVRIGTVAVNIGDKVIISSHGCNKQAVVGDVLWGPEALK